MTAVRTLDVQTFVLPETGRERIADNLHAFVLAAFPGKRVRITVRRDTKQRSLEQNAYLFGVCYPPLREATGYELGDIHEFLLGGHFGWREKRVPKSAKFPDGIERVPLRTTTTNAEGRRAVLSKMEFGEYVDYVQRFAAQHGVFIPDADPTRGRLAA